MRASTKFTYEDLKHIPPDRNRYEIVEGELLVTPAPKTLHQRIILNLAAELRAYARQRRLGEVLIAPTDVVFSSATVLEPDLLFVSNARRPIIGEDNLSGPPDLVVEVLSQSTEKMDREIKLKQYARYGVPEYWLIDPDGKTAEVFRLKDGACETTGQLQFGETLNSPLFPGLNLPVSSLWES